MAGEGRTPPRKRTGYSGSIPAARIAWVHFTVSLAAKAVACSGVPVMSAMPRFSLRRDRNSAFCAAARTAAFSRAMMGAGVPVGAARMNQAKSS